MKKNITSLLRFLSVAVLLVFTVSCEEDFIETTPHVSEIVFDSQGGDTSIVVTCPELGNWYVSDNMPEWCDVSPEKGKDGDCVVINVLPNRSHMERYFSIELSYSSSSVEIAITQKGKEVTPGREVDLGLSVKWAGWNIGASAPEEYGGYYAWGETREKDDYYPETYSYWHDENGDGYCSHDEVTDIGKDISGTEYDVAHVKWGAGWRMPTRDEIEELIDRCTWEWGEYKETVGIFAIGPNGNSIFFPAAGLNHMGEVGYEKAGGYYYSASYYEDYEYFARAIYFFPGSLADSNSLDRPMGASVRAVKN